MKTSHVEFSARRGITRIDAIVIIGVVILACSFLIVWLTGSKQRSSEMSCMARLERIGIAFASYANEHDGSFPMALSANSGGTRDYIGVGQDTYRHFQIFSNTIALPEFIVCPQDNRKATSKWQSMSNSNVSYFVGIDATSKNPATILAGDRNITPKSSDVMTFQSGLKWVEGMGLHGASGHVLLADGHVETLDSMALSNAIQQGGNPTNRVAVP